MMDSQVLTDLSLTETSGRGETLAPAPAGKEREDARQKQPSRATVEALPAMSARRGSFITFEGGEGVGKSTQVRRIAARLSALGIDVIATREPGGSPGAEILRDFLLAGTVKPLGPKAEAILFAAARIDHIDNLIAPALTAGTWVVSDRFADSTRAYQGTVGGLDPRFLRVLERVTLCGLTPDLTVILDLPAEVGLARAARRRAAGVPADRFESENLAFHEALRNAYLAIAAAEPSRCVVVNAAQDVDAVAEAVWNAVGRRLLDKFSERPWHGA
jgi:dTMP kinase